MRRSMRVGAALLAMAGLAACSVAGPGLSEDAVETTGSIGRASSSQSPLSPDLGQEDWRRAKGALAVALDPQGSGAAVKWENPDTGISGSFTPVAQPFVRSYEICRAFLAAITFPGHGATLQGTACRQTGDEWRISEVRPWRRPA